MHNTQNNSHQTKDYPAINLSLLKICWDIYQKTSFTSLILQPISLIWCKVCCTVFQYNISCFSPELSWKFNFPLRFLLTWIWLWCNEMPSSNFRLKTETFGNYFHLLHFVPVLDLSLYHVMSEPIQCLLSPRQHPIQHTEPKTWSLIMQRNNKRTPGYQWTPTSLSVFCWQWNQRRWKGG